MSLVIVAYRQEYEKRCPRGCCHEGSGRSNFDIQHADDVEKASEWIAKHIHEDTEAEYVHYVFERWQDVVNTAVYHSPYPRMGEKSIEVPGCDWGEDEETEDDKDRRERLCDKIRTLVAARLGKFSEEAKLKEEEKKQQEAAKKLAEDKRRRLAQFEQLKKEFDTTNTK
jgi:hypothetical protein